jgi:hypothetical protein
VEEERRMSSTIEEDVGQRDTMFTVRDDEPTWREVARRELAQEIAAQQHRLHALRASMLQQLTEVRNPVPRWPSGPKFVATLVDENEWWAKMLGRKLAA